jgi:hypothetical protein
MEKIEVIIKRNFNKFFIFAFLLNFSLKAVDCQQVRAIFMQFFSDFPSGLKKTAESGGQSGQENNILP